VLSSNPATRKTRAMERKEERKGEEKKEGSAEDGHDEQPRKHVRKEDEGGRERKGREDAMRKCNAMRSTEQSARSCTCQNITFQTSLA